MQNLKKNQTMKRTLLAAVSIICLCNACKKEDKRQYSYWYVNNDSFKSNNVKKDVGKAIAEINCTDEVNRFAIAFYLSFFPTSGNYPIAKSSSQNPDSVAVGFYYLNNFYIVHKEGILNVVSNNKFKCELQPTWFVAYDNANDTVLIKGTFSEP